MLGKFELVRPIRVLDLDVLAQVAGDRSWFHPEFTTRSNRAAFLRNLVKEIGQPIMPRDEEFEYLPTQAVFRVSRVDEVEPLLDGIIFHSAQTAGEGRNIVLFNHASAVEPYELPQGTKVKVDISWRSDDDFDSSITVWETVPAEKAREEKTSANSEAPSLSVIFETHSWQPDDGTEQVDYSYGEPSLRLDVQNIQVFQIRAVSYQKDGRNVSRYRKNVT